MLSALERFSDKALSAIIRENLRSALIEKKLSVQKAAERISVSEHEIAQLIDGSSIINAVTLIRLCAALSIPIERVIMPSEKAIRSNADFIVRDSDDTIEKLSNFASEDKLNSRKPL